MGRNYCKKCGKRFNPDKVTWFTPEYLLMMDDPTHYGVCSHGIFFSSHCFGGIEIIEKPKWFKESMLTTDSW